MVSTRRLQMIHLTRCCVRMAFFSCQTWPRGSPNGNGLRSLAAGCVFRPLGRQHSNRSPIYLKIVFVSSVLSFLIRKPKLFPMGFLEIEVPIEAGGDDKERHLQLKALRGDR